MHFQCVSHQCSESVVPYSEDLHPDACSRYGQPPAIADNEFARVNLRLFPGYGIGQRTQDIFSRIEEYSRRSLTFESDTLKAFYGMFNAYFRSEQLEGYLNHFWGVPISKDDGEISGWTCDSPSFSSSKDSWPSWTWASKKSRLSYHYAQSECTHSLHGSISVTLSPVNGQETHLEEFVANRQYYRNFHPTFNLTTWSLKSQLRRDKVVFPDLLWERFKAARHPSNLAGYDGDTTISGESLRVIAPIGGSNTHSTLLDARYFPDGEIMVLCLGALENIGDPAARELPYVLMFLIVAEMESGSWKRIGLWVVKVEEETWSGRSGAGTMELRSVLPDPYHSLGHEWEYTTTRVS
jgi:hypothetical protein